MATIAKFTSEVKEYTSPKTNKTKYSRYIMDEANNKGIIESDTKAVIEAIVIGATLPNPSQYQRIQGTTCYWLSGKFTPNQSTPRANAPVVANNAQTASVQLNHTNVRSGYTAEELDKLLTHYMVMFLDILKDKGVVFTEGMASIPNTWVMTATQQGVRISGSEEAVTSVVLDSKQAAVTTRYLTHSWYKPITLMDARDKAIAQAEKIKASNRSLVIPANASAECEYIIKALDQCAHDEKVTPEFVLIEWSKFEGKNSKTGQPEDKFIKDIDALMKMDAKGSKWVKKVYGAAQKWMAENHQEDESQDIPNDAIPEGAVRSDNGDDDSTLPF